MKHFFTYVTIVTYVIFRNLAGSTSRNYFNVNIILEILDQCGIGNEVFFKEAMFIEVQTRTTINDPMRVKRGRISKTCLRHWYIWQIEALFCLEVFAEQQKSISILVFHSVLEVKLASQNCQV